MARHYLKVRPMGDELVFRCVNCRHHVTLPREVVYDILVNGSRVLVTATSPKQIEKWSICRARYPRRDV